MNASIESYLLVKAVVAVCQHARSRGVAMEFIRKYFPAYPVDVLETHASYLALPE
jgi:hypothetical protein